MSEIENTQDPIKALGIKRGEAIGTRTLASYSADATARFLDGGQLAKPTYVDPVLAEALKREDARIRSAMFDKIVPALIVALEPESKQTAERLRFLAVHARKGDPESTRLMALLVSVMLTRGLEP
jgi:hypothetical protein